MTPGSSSPDVAGVPRLISRSNWRGDVGPVVAGLPVLMRPGLVLREPQLADAPLLLRSLTHDELALLVPDVPQTVSQFEWFIARVQRERRSGESFCFAIVPDDPGHPVGLIQARRRRAGSADWGFVVGPEFWGRRLFATSAALVAEYAFRGTPIRRLEARALIHNGRANRALERLGAIAEGIIRKSLITRWQTADYVLWALEREDWLARHAAPEEGWHLPPVSAAASDRSPDHEIARSPDDWASSARLRGGLPVLCDGVVSLREVETGDAGDLLGIIGDPKVARFLPQPPHTLAELERFIVWSRRQRAAGEGACLAVVSGQPPAVRGFFQLRRLDPLFETAEWGFALAPTYWGSGLFPRAATLMLRFALESLSVRRLEARVGLSNRRAAAALRKLGALRESRLPRSFLLGDDGVDEALWVIARG